MSDIRHGSSNILPAASECLQHVAISPLQCKVGALFKPLLPLTHTQGKDLLPVMLNSVKPPRMLQPQPASPAKPQPQIRPSSSSLDNGSRV